MTEDERRSTFALIGELAPHYLTKIERLPRSQQDEAITERAIAKYIQRRVNQLRDRLAQAREVYSEYANLRDLALQIGGTCVTSIEW